MITSKYPIINVTFIEDVNYISTYNHSYFHQNEYLFKLIPTHCKSPKRIPKYIQIRFNNITHNKVSVNKLPFTNPPQIYDDDFIKY